MEDKDEQLPGYDDNRITDKAHSLPAQATAPRVGFIEMVEAEHPANAPAYVRLGSFVKLGDEAAALFWLSEIEQSLN